MKKRITNFLDFIIFHEWLKSILITTFIIFKIELQYLDIVKDSFFAYSLYQMVGGSKAVLNFTTEFSIVVLFCFSASIVIPTMLATLHLIVSNPFMIFPTVSNKMKSGWRRILLIIICCLLSVLNPVFLVNSFEMAKEKTRKMAKKMDKKVIQQMRHARDIQYQWTAFIRIELGK